MSTYPIHKVSKTLLDTSLKEFEAVIDQTHKKTENTYNFDALDAMITDYAKFEAVFKLTEKVGSQEPPKLREELGGAARQAS